MADLTPWSKEVRTFSVWRRDVRLPEGVEFPHADYTGRQDTRRQKLRVRIAGDNPRRAVAEYPEAEF